MHGHSIVKFNVSILSINRGGGGHFGRNNTILDALTTQMYLDKLQVPKAVRYCLELCATTFRFQYQQRVRDDFLDIVLLPDVRKQIKNGIGFEAIGQQRYSQNNPGST